MPNLTLKSTSNLSFQPIPQFLCGLNSVVWLTVFLFMGCASVETQTRPQSLRDKPLEKPERLLIYDFAISPDEIQLDDGFGADISQLVKGTQGTPKKQLELKVGRKVARALSESLVKELGAYGILATRVSGDPPSHKENVLVVKGRFLSIHEGNMTQRMVIGFGMGRSVVKAQGQVYEVTPLGTRLISEFESEVKSGRKPGLGPMVGVGAAAGTIATSAAISGGLAVSSEVADALPFSVSLEANVQKMAKELAEKGAKFYVRKGWLPQQVLD